VGDDVSDRLTCVGEAGDHKGLVKIPRIFLALPDPTALAPTDGR